MKEHPLDGVRYKTPTVHLLGKDGNAIAILIAVENAILSTVYTDSTTGDVIDSKKVVAEFNKEAQSDDYDHLIQTVFQYCQVA